MVLMSLLFLVCMALVYGVMQGGSPRIVSQYLASFFAVVVAAFVLGLLLFQSLTQEVFVWPWQWQAYWLELADDERAMHLFLRVEALSFFLMLCLAAFVPIQRYHLARQGLGRAHFASGLEVMQTGFLKQTDESILIGKKYGVPLYSNGFEHVLVFAPTGSGKTRSIAIPNLLNYPYSMVCNDVKLTLYETTARYREKVLGQRCYCWAPADKSGKTHRFNPLSLIAQDKQHRMTDIQRIAHIIIPDSQKADPIWQQASRKLFKVMVLYLLDTPEHPTTLGEINRLIKQQSFDDWLANLLESTAHLDEEFYRNGYSYLNNHEKTRSSILETFSGYFELFDDPFVDAATSASDFDIRDLRKQKTTIYIGFSDDDMERLTPILTLFWQQLMSAMIQKIPDKREEPYPLLCLIDEFSSLGRIERLRRSLKLLREYRVRCVLMLQYIAQTYEQYSHDEAKAFTNIKTKIAFAAEDLQDAEYISKLLGMKTIRVQSGSSSSQQQGLSESRSFQYQAVPLLKPDEVMRLPASCTLIMRTGVAPVRAEQYVWYRESYAKNLN